ncbi:MAG: hypothetical protein ACI4TQ_03580, partial [Alloprevotella sp.]
QAKSNSRPCTCISVAASSKDYLASLICPGVQHFLHEFYLSFPSFVCCRQSLSMIMVMKDSENFHPLRG